MTSHHSPPPGSEIAAGRPACPGADRILLASGSAYRRELLGRLIDPVQWQSPSIDETPMPGELPAAIARRLAIAKAEALLPVATGMVIIGSDQVAAVNGRVLHKPGSAANAAAQLTACSGATVQFHTAVCVLRDDPDFQEVHVDTTTARFRTLADDEIRRYLDIDQPWDCAGSFKSEGLGIALLQDLETRDPTALIGLPLIWLAGSLRRAGLLIP